MGRPKSLRSDSATTEGVPLSQQPTGAWATVRSIGQFEYAAGGEGPPADNATVCNGDSGGPDLAFLDGTWYVVGVHHIGYACNSTPPLQSYSSARADLFSTWVRSVAPIRDNVNYRGRFNGFYAGDVNGDNKQDFVVTTSAGTQLYLSTGAGFTQVSIASSLPGAPIQLPIQCFGANCQSPSTISTIGQLTVGQVEVGLGDFDGDSHADLLAVTSVGYGIWTAKGPSYTSFNTTPYYWNPGLQVGYGTFSIGDFQGAGASQLWITDVNGSYVLKFPSSGTAVQLGAGFGARAYDSRAIPISGPT